GRAQGSGDDDCIPDCEARECGDDGCGGRCGMCPEGRACEERMGHCVSCGGGDCACKPSCDRRVCGSDGCGGSCGTCASDQSCTKNGVCQASSCGNGVVEPGEDCDGSDDCSP